MPAHVMPLESPSTIDKEIILRNILQAETEIPTLDIDIAHTEELLLRLREQRQAVVDRVNEYKRLLYPVYKLPVETLAEIFRLCSHAAPESVPWILRQVCRWWKEVADDIPELWSTVNLSLHSPRFASALAAQLGRVSVNHPASMTITPGMKPSFPDLLRQFPRTISSITCRDIKQTDLDDLFPLDFSLLNQADDLYGQLRRFCVLRTDSESHGIYDINDEDVDNFSDAAMPIPWSQLTCIELDHGMAMGGAIYFLQSLESIQECSITIVKATRPKTVHPVVLAFLRRFRLVVKTDAEYSHLFNTLTLPALKSFTLEPHANDDVIDVPIFALKARSSLDLEEFRVVDSCFEPGMVVNFLQNMPSLRSIHLIQCEFCIRPEIFSALSSQVDRLAPKLDESVVDSTSCLESSLDWIIDMLETRSQPQISAYADLSTAHHTLLRTVKISFRGRARDAIWAGNVDIQRRVKLLREQGMNISLD